MRVVFGCFLSSFELQSTIFIRSRSHFKFLLIYRSLPLTFVSIHLFLCQDSLMIVWLCVPPFRFLRFIFSIRSI